MARDQCIVRLSVNEESTNYEAPHYAASPASCSLTVSFDCSILGCDICSLVGVTIVSGDCAGSELCPEVEGSRCTEMLVTT